MLLHDASLLRRNCEGPFYQLALTGLGAMHLEGRGAPRDLVEAYKWLNLGAKAGNREAGVLLTVIGAKVTDKQIAEAKRRADAWEASET